jgi:hypothetical protein
VMPLAIQLERHRRALRLLAAADEQRRAACAARRQRADPRRQRSALPSARHPRRPHQNGGMNAHASKAPHRARREPLRRPEAQRWLSRREAAQAAEAEDCASSCGQVVVTVYRYCRRCQRQHSERHCPTCPPKRGKNPTSQQRFRKDVLANAGYRCQWVENGTQCTVTDPLEAAHRVGYADGGSDGPTNGLALCKPHHIAFERAQADARRDAYHRERSDD